MEYPAEFEQAFMKRTLSLVRTYTGPNDATLLLNCLLGLLIVPKEKSLNLIPNDPVSSLVDWGISPSCIKSFGKQNEANKEPQTLRGIVYNLRNSVAHFNITPIAENQKCVAFKFTDWSGFEAIVPIAEMRILVERLAEHLERIQR